MSVNGMCNECNYYGIHFKGSIACPVCPKCGSTDMFVECDENYRGEDNGEENEEEVEVGDTGSEDCED